MTFAPTAFSTNFPAKQDGPLRARPSGGFSSRMIHLGRFFVCSTACAAALILSTGPAGAAPAKASKAKAPPPAAAAAPDPRAGLPASYVGPTTAVAAVVNDKVITTYDVAQRLKLMLLSSGGRVPPQAIPQLQQRAVRELVEDKLKLADGEKWKVTVDDREIEDELAAMSEGTGLAPPQFLAALQQEGISLDGLREQIKARITWQQIVSGRFRSRVKITDNELDGQLQRLRDDATKEQYLVSEICIPVPQPDAARQYYEGGLQLIEQMRRGVPFAVVAQQFSACPSAAAGGDIGWVHSGELPAEIDAAVKALPVGAVTNPISSEGSFVILAVRDKRAAAVAGEKSYTLAYAGAPLDKGRNEALLAIDKLKTADACATGRARRQDIGPNVGVTLLENVKANDIDPRFRSAVEGLGRGQMSGAVEADGALHAVLVCEVDEGLGLPSRAALEDRLMSRQLGRIAQQYMRDLERQSHVDVRLKPDQALPGGSQSAAPATEQPG